jgi:hypothetical protein
MALQAGEDVNHKDVDWYSYTALHWAAWNRQDALAQALLATLGTPGASRCMLEETGEGLRNTHVCRDQILFSAIRI